MFQILVDILFIQNNDLRYVYKVHITIQSYLYSLNLYIFIPPLILSNVGPGGISAEERQMARQSQQCVQCKPHQESVFDHWHWQRGVQDPRTKPYSR